MADDMTKDDGFTTSGRPMKSAQTQIVTGMDRLVNPAPMDGSDTIFDSSFGRDINTGEVMNQGGINYKGLKTK